MDEMELQSGESGDSETVLQKLACQLTLTLLEFSIRCWPPHVLFFLRRGNVYVANVGTFLIVAVQVRTKSAVNSLGRHPRGSNFAPILLRNVPRRHIRLLAEFPNLEGT